MTYILHNDKRNTFAKTPFFAASNSAASPERQRALQHEYLIICLYSSVEGPPPRSKSETSLSSSLTKSNGV